MQPFDFKTRIEGNKRSPFVSFSTSLNKTGQPENTNAISKKTLTRYYGRLFVLTSVNK
jgi:hypothetical protein